MGERKTRIAFLITDLDVGGAERNLCMLARGLDRERFEVSAASLLAPGTVGEELSAAGISVTDVHMGGYGDCRAVARVARWLRQSRPDVLHTWLFHANVLGRLAARWVGVRGVVSSIRVAEPRRLHLAGERLTACLADCILVNSTSLRDYMIGAGLRPEVLRVIPNAVDLERFAAGEQHSREGERPVVLFVGRLAAQKGVDVLLRAASDERLRGAAEFVIAGDGPDRAMLAALAQDLDLEHVRFIGRTDRVPELLGEADVLVLPSRWEGLPNVVLEALAARCPVVATDVIGTRDLIRDGENGLMVPPEDASALAGALRRMLDDAVLRERVVKSGRETARRHSVASMVKAHVALYGELLARRRRTR
ncbi:MAG TPA: glycosyltransferase family 4 protein [Planctomycetota bacterium]|nr:glycosyltransferase family 4 protein [Planctomycetota bacterium]